MGARDCNHGREAVSRRCDSTFHYPLPIATRYLMVREPGPLDPNELMARLSDARCFIECAVRSLDERQDASRPGVEIVCIRHGLGMLAELYAELDVLMGHRSVPD